MILPSPRLGAQPLLTDAQAETLLRRVTAHTMVHDTGVRFTMEAALYAIEEDIPGVFVECGAWKGGCAFAMLLAQRERYGEIRRPVHILDSFAGLPAVGERDGPLAKAWQAGADPAKFFDNCKVAREELLATIAELGFAKHEAVVWEGWFADTLPQAAEAIGPSGVALLRLDGDWYDSTFTCLDALMPLTAENAAVIIDDYYAWDGCARAVHDYLAAHDLPYRIKSLPYNFGAFLIKQQARRSFEEF